MLQSVPCCSEGKGSVFVWNVTHVSQAQHVGLGSRQEPNWFSMVPCAINEAMKCLFPLLRIQAVTVYRDLSGHSWCHHS